MPEERAPVGFRFRAGDHAVVREHNQFRGCVVEVTGVDEARRVVFYRMHVWPGQPPVPCELGFAEAEDLWEGRS